MDHPLYGVRQKIAPTVFRCFLSNYLECEMWCEILHFYLVIRFTSNCQAKVDSVKKQRSFGLFTMTAYRFLALKMFKLLYQCNNIVKTQLTNDQMPEFHCQCECLKCPPPAPSFNTSLQLLTLISLLQPCRSVHVAGCPDNLKRFLDFGGCFRLCF